MVQGFIASSVLCSAVVFSQIAYAIVDIESLRNRAGNETGYSSSGNLQASGASGNSDRADVSFSALLQYLGNGFSNLFERETLEWHACTCSCSRGCRRRDFCGIICSGLRGEYVGNKPNSSVTTSSSRYYALAGRCNNNREAIDCCASRR